jgi:hypothetical protein
MDKAQFGSDMIAVVPGEITVYNFDSSTYEYRSSSVEYVAVGVGLPAHSCIDAPPSATKGTVICRTADFSAWESIINHRGETVYSKETGQPVTIISLGDYPSETTCEVPATPYDKWDGTKWATDLVAKHDADVESAEEQRLRLLNETDEITSDWKIALMLDDISEDDKNKLAKWMAYKSELKATDISVAPDINWPIPPEM